VFVGGAPAEVHWFSGEHLEVQVPYGAASDTVLLQVADKRATGAVTLLEAERPEPWWDDASGRFVVDLVPSATDTDREELLAELDAELLGCAPLSNAWQVGLDDTVTLAALRELLLEDPRVEGVDPLSILEPEGLNLDSDPYPGVSDFGEDTQSEKYAAITAMALDDAWRLFNTFGGTPLVFETGQSTPSGALVQAARRRPSRRRSSSFTPSRGRRVTEGSTARWKPGTGRTSKTWSQAASTSTASIRAKWLPTQVRWPPPKGK